MKILKRSALLFLLLTVSSFARAEYVCEALLYDNLNGSSYGQNGFVLARYYSARSCGGTFLGQKWYCSAGATASGCAANERFHFSEQGLMSIYQNLVNAAHWNRQVRATNAGCFSGASTCGGSLFFTSMY